MKHITEKYGTACNYIQCTMEEYKILDKFLEQLGVEIRMCKWDTSTDTVEIQCRNNYKDWCILYRNNNITGKLIEERVKEEISSGHWRR